MTALIRKLKPENEQGANEEIFYRFSTTPWGGSPSGVSLRVLDVTADFSDVTSEVSTQGETPTVEGDLISLPRVKNLKAGRVYRLLPRFMAGGKTLEPIFIVFCTR
ncbi:MAG: hypothetical protein AB1453_10355 [Chloroflexota bacterium]